MIIRTKEEISQVLELLASQLTWTFDIETTGLNPRKDLIIGFGCASPDTMQAFYIITHAWEVGPDGQTYQLVEKMSKSAVLPVVEALAKKRLITWNGSFDTRFTYHYYGVDLSTQIFCDGMLLVHTVDENKPTYGLKALGLQEFGPTATGDQSVMLASIKANGGSEKEYFKADSELMAKYGITDNILTAKLYKKYDKELKSQGLSDFFYRDEIMPLYREVIIPMERKGIPVNLELIYKTQTDIRLEIAKIEKEIQIDISPLLEDFNKWFLNKDYPVKLSGSFLQKLAEHYSPKLPKTKTGNYSFTEAALAKLEDCEFKRIVELKDRINSDVVAKVQAELMAADGIVYPFNLSSKDHLKRLFFTKLEETALSFTEPSKTYPEGQPQVNDTFLDLMAQKYEWASKLQVYNSLNKINSTYIEGVLASTEDGVYYPQFFMHRTTSGRLSGNAQQMPRKKSAEEIPNDTVRGFTNLIRDFFISGPGYSLADADYSSLEVVVFADDAQDEPLLDIIRKDLDFYSIIAMDAYNLKELSGDKKAPNFLKNMRPELRQAAKAFALGFRYNLQPYLLSKNLNISEEMAKGIHKRYFQAYPKLKNRMDELITSAKKLGYVKSKSGRVRHLGELKRLHNQYGEVLYDGLELWKKYNEDKPTYAKMKKLSRTAKNLINNALNFPIQNMAASIVSKASIEIMREFKVRGMEAYIALSVHDELCVRCPDSEAEEVAVIMQDLMENTTKLSVPLRAEPQIGTCYGEVK